MGWRKYTSCTIELISTPEVEYWCHQKMQFAIFIFFGILNLTHFEFFKQVLAKNPQPIWKISTLLERYQLEIVLISSRSHLGF